MQLYSKEVGQGPLVSTHFPFSLTCQVHQQATLPPLYSCANPVALRLRIFNPPLTIFCCCLVKTAIPSKFKMLLPFLKVLN